MLSKASSVQISIRKKNSEHLEDSNISLAIGISRTSEKEQKIAKTKKSVEGVLT
jgi:hypothetical protein